MSSEYAIEVEGLQKTFGKVPVLRQVDFKVKKGTIFTLLGSNGAGKTTTIKILTTLMRRDKGRVEICGYDVERDAHKVRDSISLTGQFAAVDEMLTGYENLVMTVRFHHLRDAKLRARELLEYFDLEAATHRKVSTYSGGMRRKLDIAMSLVNAPAVLFLDEPTTGLDPMSKRMLWNTIQELKRQGTTIFLTTQYLEEAEELSDHIAILDKGKILVEGRLEELKKLLPYGMLEFTFAKELDLDRALASVSAYPHVIEDRANVKMSVRIERSEDVITLFQLFTSMHIKILEFSSKSPTLEDIFLSLVGKGV